MSPKNRKLELRQNVSRKVIRFAGYVAALALLLALDNAVESAKYVKFEEGGRSADIFARIFSPSILYPYLTGAGSKRGNPAYVAVVTIGKDEPDLYNDYCTRRRVIADLIAAARLAQVAGIALDYSFNETGCDSEFSTELLRRQLLSTNVRSNVPVVLGQSTESFEELRATWPPFFQTLTKQGFSQGELFISAPNPFSLVNAKSVHVGLMRLDFDNHKIPLSWPVRNSEGQLQTYDTLAVATVSAARESDLPFQRHLETLKKTGRHPIGSFFEEDKIPLISASDFICGSPTVARHWPVCKHHISGARNFSFLKGRVLVIGMVDPDGKLDIHETAIGRVSGIMLQANYIDALIADSFLKSVRPEVQIAIGIVWFVLVEAILRRFRGSVLHSIVFPLIIISIAWITISVLLLFMRFYVELLFPSILVIVVAHISRRIEDELQPSPSVPSAKE